MCIVRLLAAAFVALLAAGCQTPNLSPLADHARDVRASLDAVADELEIELSAMPDGVAAAEQFRHAWAPRRRSIAALVEYVQSLEAIAEAAREGQATAAAVAEALQEVLAPVPGITAAPGIAPSLAIDAGQLITAQLIAVRAAANLREAMQQAQPLIDAFAGGLAQDIAALDAIVQLAHAAARLRITADHNAMLSLRADVEAQLQRAASTGDTSRAHELTAIVYAVEPAYERYQQQMHACDEQAKTLRKRLRDAARTLTSLAAAHRRAARNDE